MILIPSTKTRNGLIYTYGFKGRTFASSTNLNYTRKENPILPNSKDRWCSEETGQYSVETWEVHLDHYIYITNYTFSNQNNHADTHPLSWKLEGFKPTKGWETLSVIEDSPIGNGQYETYQTIHSGPYNIFRFSSIENGYDRVLHNYHFCIYKVDFFGAAFPIPQRTNSLRNHLIIQTKKKGDFQISM